MFLAIFKICAAIVFSLLFWLSLKKSKSNQFYSDVPKFLLPSGIFVWGDGLVLAPFWVAAFLFSLLMKLSFLQLVQFYLLFIIVRSGYETIYWIQHQMVKKDYKPPHFRHIEWLGAEEQGIIYQLLNISVIVFSAAVLYLTL